MGHIIKIALYLGRFQRCDNEAHQCNKAYQLLWQLTSEMSITAAVICVELATYINLFTSKTNIWCPLHFHWEYAAYMFSARIQDRGIVSVDHLQWWCTNCFIWGPRPTWCDLEATEGHISETAELRATFHMMWSWSHGGPHQWDCWALHWQMLFLLLTKCSKPLKQCVCLLN